MDVPQRFCVRWNSYKSNLQTAFPKLLTSEHFVDVTLACEKQFIKCHKIVLSACSAYFETLLVNNPCQHPIIFMKDVQFWEIKALVEFMYKGEVNISQNQLDSLLKSAESLQIRGLSGTKQLINFEQSDDSPDDVVEVREECRTKKSKCDNEEVEEECVKKKKKRNDDNDNNKCIQITSVNESEVIVDKKLEKSGREPSPPSSQRKQRKLIHENHIYTLSKKTNNDKYGIWVCEKRSICKGRVWTDGVNGEVVKVVREHTHTPQIGRPEALRLRDKIKELATTSNEKPQRIVGEVVAGAQAEVAALLPKVESVKQLIRRVRRTGAAATRKPSEET